jgi:hypothetical protein
VVVGEEGEGVGGAGEAVGDVGESGGAVVVAVVVVWNAVAFKKKVLPLAQL